MFKIRDGGKSRISSILIFFMPWLWLILIIPSSQATKECCPQGTTWNGAVECSDGSKIRLNCSAFYQTDPASEDADKFVIQQNGSVLVFLDSSVSVPHHSFCLLNKKANYSTALICFDDEEEDSFYHWRYYTLGAVTSISSFFLILTLIIYGILPELRDIQDKTMICAMTSLTVGYLVLAIELLRPYIEGFENFCVTIGFLIYYAFLTTFFWLNLVAFNIWRSVWFKSFPLKENSLFAVFCIIGWGCPTCFLIAALTTHHTEGLHLKPRFGELSCWFGGDMEIWAYFYGPIAILLILNVIYLGLTSWRLWQEYRDYSGCRLRALRFRCLMYIKLVLVMGITWIFEVLSSIQGWKNSLMWIPTDILNGLQGLIIFILLVVTRNKVKKLLVKKRPCGIRFPKSWAVQEDEECDAVLPEEVELSHST